MNLVLIFLIFIICFAYFGYPIVLILISFFRNNPVSKDDNFRPSVSILIAAYNEESFIKQKILNTLELNYPKDLFSIVVVSDGSTDKTDEIVLSYQNQGVKLLRVEGRVGKTEARNQAVIQDRSDIIVFSDATAIYEKDAIIKLVRNFSDKSVGMVSGNLRYVEQKSGHMGLATKLYWNYERAIKFAQSKLWTLTGAVGCINAFRRDLYHVLPSNIIEDFTEPLMIIAQNYRIVFESEAIAYERTTQEPQQEFLMRVRVIRGGMRGFIYAISNLNITEHIFPMIQLICHKVLRWLAPIFLITLFLLSSFSYVFIPSSISTFLFLSQILFYGIGMLGLLIKMPLKILSIPSYFLIINAASFKALYLTMTKDLEATWETNIY
jgi:cellulose synthase/poly-beta-1,6-N-acetylglucosamine synthase-like glycosyltransferase